MNHEDTKGTKFKLDEATEMTARLAVDAAFHVHSTLGPGLSERVYEACFVHECRSRGMSVAQQVHVPVVYGDLRIEAGLRLDLLLDNRVVIELKAVETILPLHRAQLITYLKVAHHSLGLLINFNVPLIKDGIHRIVV